MSAASRRADAATSMDVAQLRVPRLGRARRVHRQVAALFTLSVAANFAVMPWGQPPAWITYAPLPPLLFFLVSGLAMLVSPWFGGARASRVGEAR